MKSRRLVIALAGLALTSAAAAGGFVAGNSDDGGEGSDGILLSGAARAAYADRLDCPSPTGLAADPPPPELVSDVYLQSAGDAPQFDVKSGRLYLIVMRPSGDADVALQVDIDPDVLTRTPNPYPDAVSTDCGILAQSNENGPGDPEALALTAAADHRTTVQAVGPHGGLSEFFVIEGRDLEEACDIASRRDVLVMNGHAPACQTGEGASTSSTSAPEAEAASAAAPATTATSAGPEALMAEWERVENTCRNASASDPGWRPACDRRNELDIELDSESAR